MGTISFAILACLAFFATPAAADTPFEFDTTHSFSVLSQGSVLPEVPYFQVPPDASRFTVTGWAAEAGSDVDILLRFGQPLDLSSVPALYGSADYSGEDPTGNELIVVTPDDQPPLQSGRWYFQVFHYSGPDTTVYFRAEVEVQVESARLGGLVWNDLDGDAAQGVGEPGIAGVSVDLVADTNGNGLIDGGEPELTTRTTDGAGSFDFTGLAPGAYLVDVTDTTNVLNDFVLTTGSDPRAVNLAAGEDFDAADFGYRQPTPANVAPRPGMWWNPARSGHGLDLQLANNGSVLATAWYTYDPDGTPTFYTAAGPWSEEPWSATLNRHTWDWTTYDIGAIAAGDLTLSFASDTEGTLSWSIDGQGVGSEPIVWYQAVATPAPSDITGHWFNPDLPGYGLTIAAQGDLEVVTVYLYDRDGNARWAQGLRGETAETIPLNVFSGPCPGCAYTAPQPQAAGHLNFRLDDINNGVHSTQILLPPPLSGEWSLTNAPLQRLSDAPMFSGIGVSPDVLEPGQFLSVSCPAITAGAEVRVAFAVAGASEVTVGASHSKAGRAVLPVPPLVDGTGEPHSGPVTVSLEGITGSAQFTLRPLSTLNVPTGSLMAAVLQQNAARYAAARDSLDGVADLTQADVSDLEAALTRMVDGLSETSATLQSEGTLFVHTDPHGDIALGPEQIAQAEAYLYNLVESAHQLELEETYDATTASARIRNERATDEPSDIDIDRVLSQIKNGGTAFVGGVATTATVAGLLIVGASEIPVLIVGVAAAGTTALVLGVHAEMIAALDAALHDGKRSSGQAYAFGDEAAEQVRNALMNAGVALAGSQQHLASQAVNYAGLYFTSKETIRAINELFCGQRPLPAARAAFCNAIAEAAGIEPEKPAISLLHYVPRIVDVGDGGVLRFAVSRGARGSKDFTIDWGDGGVTSGTTIGGFSSRSHAYADTFFSDAYGFTVPIGFTVTDANGDQASLTTQAIVVDKSRPPAVSLTPATSRLLRAKKGDWRVTINHGSPPYHYDIYWDDTLAGGYIAPEPTVFDMANAFGETGEHGVRVSVRDADDHETTVTATADVQDPMRIDRIDGPSTANVGEENEWRVYVTDGWPPYKGTVDYDDGVSFSGHTDTGRIRLTHTYTAAPATRLIQVRLTDDEGHEGVATQRVVVDDGELVVGATYTGTLTVQLSGRTNVTRTFAFEARLADFHTLTTISNFAWNAEGACTIGEVGRWEDETGGYWTDEGTFRIGLIYIDYSDGTVTSSRMTGSGFNSLAGVIGGCDITTQLDLTRVR